jgi:hypothetical protein
MGSSAESKAAITGNTKAQVVFLSAYNAEALGKSSVDLLDEVGKVNRELVKVEFSILCVPTLGVATVTICA